MDGVCGKSASTRESYWRSQIAACGQSGLSIAGYCRRHKVAQWQYHWWKRELKRRDACVVRPVFAEVRIPDALLETPPGIEVVLRGGRRLVVRPGFDAATLTAVVDVLERASC